MATTASTPNATPETPAVDNFKSRARFVRQVLRLVGPYWNGERRVKARVGTLLLLLLTIGQVALTVWGNYWNRALYDALEQRSVRRVLIQVAVFALILASSMRMCFSSSTTRIFCLSIQTLLWGEGLFLLWMV